MDSQRRAQADTIVREAIAAVMPQQAVCRALEGVVFPGAVVPVAAGKAAWSMAKAAADCLGSRLEQGIVLTKYGHVPGPLENFLCHEGGHPVPDENSFAGTQKALEMVRGLSAQDTVLFLLSGGASALFEWPLLPARELQDITGQLLACGADIGEINTVRKRLSAVKGGRFAQLCQPARVYSVILSDVLGDRLDMIASGPACPDRSTAAQALAVAKKYGLRLSDRAWELLGQETPKELTNVTNVVTGSVRELCAAAAESCRRLGYEPVVLTTQLCCQARQAGEWLAGEVKKKGLSGQEAGPDRWGRDGCPSHRQGKGRAQPGACPGGSPAPAGDVRVRFVQCGKRRNRWPHRCRRGLCGWGHGPGFGGNGDKH